MSKNSIGFRHLGGHKITPISISQYPGRKVWFLQHAARFFRVHPCHTLIECFGGSAVIGLSLLQAGRIERLVLVEFDPRVATLLSGSIYDPDIADKYEAFDCTRDGVEQLLANEQSAFRWLVQSRVCWRAKFDGGLRTVIDERYCRKTVVESIRRIQRLNDRIEVVHGDGLEVMARYANDPSIGCFADPPFSADPKSRGRLIYKYWRLNHFKLFFLLRRWAGPWLLTEDNTPMVRQLVACHRFKARLIRMNSSDNKTKEELVISRRGRSF